MEVVFDLQTRIGEISTQFMNWTNGTLLKGICLAILVVAVILMYLYFSRPPTKIADQKPAPRSPQKLLIESKGLREFSSEHDVVATLSSEEKQLGIEMMPLLKSMGDGKNVEKNKEAVAALNKIIQEFPEYGDAYLIRATASILVGDTDYRKVLSDVDHALRLHSTGRFKDVSQGSLGAIYGLRTKIDLLANDYPQAVNDLETGIKNEPDSSNSVFNTGGVKPEDDSNPTALHKVDLDALIAKYPDDYRVYMFRGLFYASFSTYGEQYNAPALSDLKQALKTNPKSALVNYCLGSVVQKMTFWTKAAWADISGPGSGGYRDRTHETALSYFKEAVRLDPQFKEAYAQVAESLYSLKRYSEAIPYYDNVIELDPSDGAAYNDRGLAKKYSTDYYGAISDFSNSLRLKKPGSLSLENTYENRANAYVEVGNYDSAIDDFGNAIGRKFSMDVFLMNTAQIRAIYPEFGGLSETDLLEGLRQKYCPHMSFADFATQHKNPKPFNDSVLSDLYVARGDAYLSKRSFKKASAEYSRAFYGSGTSLDRWRVISKTSTAEYSIDAQTLNFAQGNLASLWLKSSRPHSSDYDEQNFQLDFPGRKIKSLSWTLYSSTGSPLHSNGEQTWEPVVPESIGEVLYDGMCR